MMQRPIMIQGALQSEIDLLIKEFAPHKKREIGGFLFYECDYRKTPVVISKTKMGEVCAAIATTLAIEHYRPAWILNQGTAGACDERLHAGDVVVGERVVYLSQYATKSDRERDALNPWKSRAYQTLDGEMISMATDHRLLKWIETVTLPIDGSVCLGTLGSGDVWTTDVQTIRDNRERLGVLCESMECTGVYMAANSQGVPAISVRVISNNELIGEQYLPSCGTVAEHCAKYLVDAWINLGEKTPF